LLAVHAYFYANGMVPRGGALNETRYYRVFKSAPTAACYVEVWTVAIIGGALGNVIGEYARRAIDYGFANLLRDSIRQILLGQPSSMPPEMRETRTLSAQDARNAPVFDTEAEHKVRWQQLRERATNILPQTARPVGRSAGKLAITSGSLQIGEIDNAVLQRLLAVRDAAITEAVAQLRLSMGYDKGPGMTP
jgi:hypothetical protein